MNTILRSTISFAFYVLCLVTFQVAAQPESSNSDSLRITVSDGTQLHVTVRGDGIPCLYIHGGPGVGSFWMEELYGDVLEKHFKMIYLDQRGSGRSASAATGDYSPERLARDFEEVRLALGIKSWITFSHSFGGLLQMEHAKQYPATIQAMVMVASTLNLNESAEQMINFAVRELEIDGEVQKANLDQSKYPIERLMPLFVKLREKGVFWKAYYANERNYARMDSVMSQSSSQNYEFSSRAFTIADYYHNYKPLTNDIDVPVLLYYGHRDFAVGPKHYEGINFTNTTLHVWDGGHVPFMEGKKELEVSVTNWLKTIQ